MTQQSKKEWGSNAGPRLLAGALLLGLGMLGCSALFDSLRGPEPLSSFPHGVHVVDMEMACEDCHEPPEEAGNPSLPGKDLCTMCHEEDAAILEPFFLDGEAKWIDANRQSEEILFEHSRHVDAVEGGCRACHGAVAESSALFADMKMSMDECTACHQAQRAKEESCSLCHRVISEDTPPATHGGAWEIQHGDHTRNPGHATANRCELCHSPQGCDDCHHSRLPRSHTNFWQLRGHGITAGIDRNRCEVCHDRDACDQCHSTTRPLSHSAAFGSPKNRHCYACHLPLSSTNGCMVCHQDAFGHELAPALPDNATHRQATADRCRACHAPVPHPDNGDDCRFCHF